MKWLRLNPRAPQIEGQAFILRDQRGNVRARLETSPDGLSLSFSDANGVERASLGVTVVGAGLTLHDATGSIGAIMAVSPDGTTSNLSLTNSPGKTLAELHVAKVGPTLLLSDSQGFNSTLGAFEYKVLASGEIRRTAAAALTMLDKDWNVIWAAPPATAQSAPAVTDARPRVFIAKGSAGPARRGSRIRRKNGLSFQQSASKPLSRALA